MDEFPCSELAEEVSVVELEIAIVLDVELGTAVPADLEALEVLEAEA